MGKSLIGLDLRSGKEELERLHIENYFKELSLFVVVVLIFKKILQGEAEKRSDSCGGGGLGIHPQMTSTC